jgi:hypothetical protein
MQQVESQNATPHPIQNNKKQGRDARGGSLEADFFNYLRYIVPRIERHPNATNSKSHLGVFQPVAVQLI